MFSYRILIIFYYYAPIANHASCLHVTSSPADRGASRLGSREANLLSKHLVVIEIHLFVIEIYLVVIYKNKFT